MKIKKFTEGGMLSYIPYFLGSTAAQTTNQQNTAASTKDTNFIEKEIISIMKENGIPNDVDYFLSAANSLLRKSKNAGGLFSTGEMKDYFMSDLIKIQSMANKIRFNNELYSQASSKIRSEDAGSEVAMTNTGQLYVLSEENGLQTISANEYHKNPDTYQVLTNTDLLKLRSQLPGLTLNSDVLSDMSNVIGMKSVEEFIKSTIKSFGTLDASQSTQQYTATQKEQIKDGLQQLLGLSGDGVYKIQQSIRQQDQGYNSQDKSGDSLKQATRYLYRALPQNMRNVLKANAVAEGLDPSKEEDLLNFLALAITQHTNHSFDQKTTVDYDKQASTAAGKGKDGSTTNISFGTFVHRDMGDVRNNAWVLPGGNIKFTLPSRHYDLRTFKNEAISNITTAGEAFQTLRDHGLLDTRGKIMFGGIPLEQIASQGNEIIVDNSRGLDVAYLPINANGNVDMNIFKIMTEIQERIQNEKITDSKQIRQIWEDNGFVYDENEGIGKPYNVPTKRFVLLTAYTSSKGQIEKSVMKDDPMISKIDKDIYNNLINSYNLNPNNKKKLDDVSWYNGPTFQGLLFIPINDNENASYLAGNIAYTQKPDVDYVKAQQDATRLAGGYDPNTGTYNRVLNGMTVNGITSNSLD